MREGGLGQTKRLDMYCALYNPVFSSLEGERRRGKEKGKKEGRRRGIFFLPIKLKAFYELVLTIFVKNLVFLELKRFGFSSFT